LTMTERKLIAFDLDGTIFETEELAVFAVQKTMDKLKKEGLYSRPKPEREECLSVLGMISEEIWDFLLPGSDREVQNRADQLLEAIEKDYLKKGLGNLYPGVKETLEKLKVKGWDFLIASNGGEGYVKSVIEVHGLNPLFAGIYSAGEYQTKEKGDLLRISRQKFPRLQAMVGDRRSDVEAGQANNLITVGCRYGYGYPRELQEADYKIDSFPEIIDLFASA